MSIFPASQITGATVLRDTPSGDTDIVSFVLAGYAFQAISAGPVFKLNPSVSFAVNCATAGEVDALWAKLADGGQALMPLDAYPFNPRHRGFPAHEKTRSDSSAKCIRGCVTSPN